MTELAASLDSIRAARQRIADHVHVTPVMTSTTLNRLAGRRLFLKCENLQRAGAFKIRGALNAVLSLPAEVARRGVVTHSSGNFAQALALASSLAGITAHIVMPTNVPEAKRAAVLAYGGKITTCEPTLEARESSADAIARETGATLIHPFDHADVISGQGTVALELLEQVPELDAVITPVGGGGLVSGIAVAAKALVPDIKVLAAEPSGADDAARSKAKRELVPQRNPHTIADGLRTSLGQLTWPIVRDHVDRVITVDDSDIVAAMRICFERLKLVVEPSGAIGVAAMLTDVIRAMPGMTRVGVVLSGGNVDLDALPFGRGDRT